MTLIPGDGAFGSKRDANIDSDMRLHIGIGPEISQSIKDIYTAAKVGTFDKDGRLTMLMHGTRCRSLYNGRKLMSPPSLLTEKQQYPRTPLTL